MKYALVDNIETLATISGTKGVCQFCGSELIAKCGIHKVNHWAHKGTRNCDSWWEPETEWHRAWKDNFASDWQEVILFDEITGEKHIADIRTTYGRVIEFQHSYINPNERTKRENFYKEMFWVIDGTRLNRDYPRFLEGKQNFRRIDQNIYLVPFPEECFPKAWIGSSVPVIFDFKGTETIRYANDWRYPLYCLYPKSNDGKSFVAIWNRELFISRIKTGEFFKQKQEPEKQIAKPQINSSLSILRRPS